MVAKQGTVDADTEGSTSAGASGESDADSGGVSDDANEPLLVDSEDEKEPEGIEPDPQLIDLVMSRTTDRCAVTSMLRRVPFNTFSDIKSD